LTDEGFCQIYSNSDSPIAFSSSPNTSQEIIPNENYSFCEDPYTVRVQASDDFVPATPLYQSSFSSLSPYPMDQQQEFQQQPYFQNSMMPWMQSPFIPYPYPYPEYPQAVYNHCQMQNQQNFIPPYYSEALLGDYVPVPAQNPVMTAPDPFSLQTCNGAYLIHNSFKRISGSSLSAIRNWDFLILWAGVQNPAFCQVQLSPQLWQDLVSFVNIFKYFLVVCRISFSLYIAAT